MFGVPTEGPTNMYCDNEAVVKNCSTPESTLNIKHHSISYHFNREAVAAGIIWIAWEQTATNLADGFTKLMTRDQREDIFDRIMY